MDYRRIENIEQHSGNATAFLHQLRAVWKSPWGTVLRIEALALVAIAISFFLAAFGSCRRWSNNWALQKCFLAANALFLSLGAYTIGLMQSSSVKSEMYPIWAVSLLALFCCVDSVTAFSFDYKSQLWKVLYQLCLFCGYVLLMSVSNISSGVGNLAIAVLSAITFIKGFHRSLALVLPSRMGNMVRAIPDGSGNRIHAENVDFVTRGVLVVDFPLDNVEPRSATWQAMNLDHRDVTMLKLDVRPEDGELGSYVIACSDVCLSFSLSHLLQRRFLGFNSVLQVRTSDDSLVSIWTLLKRRGDGIIDYQRAFKVVEAELAFLYDIFFTSNAFLQYYEAKTASICAFASVVGICFVGAAVVVPGAAAKRHVSHGAIVAATTRADLVVTGVILVSVATLQVLQLLLCWTSNWARVAFACDFVRNQKEIQRSRSWWWWMRMKASLIKISRRAGMGNLWQNKLGQHSLVDSSSRGECILLRRFRGCLSQAYALFSGTLGLQYIEQVLREMWGSNTGDAIELHTDVRAYIAEFVQGIKSEEVAGWSSSLVACGVAPYLLPYSYNPPDHARMLEGSISETESYTCCILAWHIATCYCELAQQRDKGLLNDQCTESERAAAEKHRGVALALSKYCAYLLVSAPGLLPGQPMDMKYVYQAVEQRARDLLRGRKQGKLLGAMENHYVRNTRFTPAGKTGTIIFGQGVELGQELRRKPTPVRWKVLAEFWVQALLYAAPSDNVEEHMQHLSQGGEFITHLWALLYHAGILKWRVHGQGTSFIYTG